MLVEFTSAWNDQPMAIDVTTIGIGQPKPGIGQTGTVLIYRTNCRQQWWAREPYSVVMERIRAASNPATPGTTGGPA